MIQILDARLFLSNHIRSLACLSVLSVLLLAGISASPVFAQNGAKSENKSDSTLKSFARVNPSTLAMELSIPLGSHPGRNGNSLPIVLSYSSKMWEAKVEDTLYSDSSPVTPRTIDIFQVARFQYSLRSFAGWSSSLQPPRIIRSNSLFVDRPGSEFGFQGEVGFSFPTTQLIDLGTFTAYHGGAAYCETYPSKSGSCEVCVGGGAGGPVVYDVNCSTSGVGGGGAATGGNGGSGTSPNEAIVSIVKRIQIAMPDGSVTEFRKDDSLCQGGFQGSGNQTTCNSDIEGTYLAVNGSRMKFEYNELQSSGQKRHVLYLPNGSRYLFPVNGESSAPFSQEAEEFVDVHGNQMTFDPSTRTWSDTMGRSIVSPFSILDDNVTNPETEDLQTLNLPTMAGASQRQSQLVWKRLKAVGCESDTTGTCGENVLENPAQELPYVGSETCGPNWPTRNTNQPALFLSSESSNTTNGVTRNYRENVCGNKTSNPTATRFNPVVLKEIVLPNGKKYEFRYNVYGEISKITYPTGAVERFTYDSIVPMGFEMHETYSKSNRGVVERRVYFSESDVASNTPTQTWLYEANLIPPPVQFTSDLYQVKITAPDGSYSERLIHRTRNPGYGFSNATDGLTYDSKTYSVPNGSGVSRILSRTLTEWTQQGPMPGVDAYPYARRDARIEKTISIVFEDGKALGILNETDYDDSAGTDPAHFAHLNATKTTTSHYVALDATSTENDLLEDLEAEFATAEVASVAETDYLYDQSYLDRHIVGLVDQSRVLNPENQSIVLSKSEVEYDEGGQYYIDSGSTVGYQAPTGANSNLRGNVTTTRVFDFDNQTWIETHLQYDNFGNVRKSWDALGRITETEFSSQYYFSYPTKTIAPAPGNGISGTSQSFETETSFDLSTGLVTVTKDLRDLATSSDDLSLSVEYNDALLRQTATVAANGARTEFVYSDAPGSLWVKTRSQFDTDVWQESESHFDNLFRVIRTRKIDLNGDVIVETKYDEMGRETEVSNPYREGSSPSEILWTKTTYDDAGRVEETFSPKAEGQTGESAGTRAYGIVDNTGANLLGVWVVSTDASGRKSRSVTNTLGQVVRVDEPTSFGGTIDADLGTITAPHQPTSYKYNVKGELIEVTQGVQKRYFLYDSLGRLIRVRQPEQEVNSSLDKVDPETGNSQWTAGFQYDVVGNLVSSTDANNTVITYTHDNADRVLTRSYSDGTPTVSYKYDLINGSIANSKGALVETSNSVSTSKFSQFDQWGRPTKYLQITDGITYASKYTYNLSGALIEEEYPSGRKVKHEFDEDGQVSRVFGQPTSTSIDRTYANGFRYAPDGRIERLRLGNGLWEKATFNDRLQVTEMGVGIGVENLNRWKIGYDYKENLAAGGDANTGTPVSQTITVEGLANPFIQTYKYDSLYRITEAKEMNAASQTWIETFGYDRYGNRTSFSQDLNGTQLPLNNITHPSIDPATNRFNSGQGYQYDQVGNLVTDVDSSGSRDIVFNGDNKQIEVKETGTGNKIGEYFYDGDGRRIKKIAYSGGSPIETVTFVYSGSKLIAEYSSLPPASEPRTKYVATDTLGSVRLLTDEDGQVASRRDFLPFGQELPSDASYRQNTLGYVGDDIRQKFTGYLKDDETGLNFAEARMYSENHGRFTAVDPLLSSGKSPYPQTFNRYVYVMSNPLSLTDPSGLQASEEPFLEIQSWPARFRDWLNNKLDAFTGRPTNSRDARNACYEGNCVRKGNFADAYTGGRGFSGFPGDELARRKSGGSFYMPDNQVLKSAFLNWSAGNKKLTSGMESVDPTGFVQLTRTTVEVEMGKAPVSDLYWAYGEVGFNVATAIPLGLENLGARVLASSGVGEILPMQVVRTIGKGEKVADIINEAKAITWETGQEVALVTLANGERALVKGGEGGISFAEGQIKRIFGHTHPDPSLPSVQDANILKELGNSQQRVFNFGCPPNGCIVRPPR